MGTAMGGTELTKKWLYEHVDNSLLSKVNIVSRPDDYKDGELNILWVHDLPADMPFLASPADKSKFAGIVFVSSWQQTVFFMNMGVKYSESTVIRNAIRPIEQREKTNDGEIRLVYHPTPHRGLEILVPVFTELCKKYPNLHLDVFSNFDIYDRSESNTPFEPLYDICRKHPHITYHGTKDNDTVRNALADSHIFAYPSIWRETSCISAMEAMSARCLVVAPDYSALSETVGTFGYNYPWIEHPDEHANRFAENLIKAIEDLQNGDVSERLDMQKAYIDRFYNWDLRKLEWERYLTQIVNNPRPKKSRGLQWN